MRLTEAEVATLAWLGNSANCDVPMSEPQLATCDVLGKTGHVGFVRSTDGNYVTITDLGRAALAQSVEKK